MCTSVIQEDSIKILNHKPSAYELLSSRFSLSKDRPLIPRTSWWQRSSHYLYFCIWTPRHTIPRRFSEVFQIYPFAKNVRCLNLYQVLSISCCRTRWRSIDRSADEVTDWDKKFKRRQQTFSLYQTKSINCLQRYQQYHYQSLRLLFLLFI